MPTPRPAVSGRLALTAALALPWLALLAEPHAASAQSVDRDQTGAWYMLFWNTTFDGGPWGLQGDVQYRDWALLGDMEQLLLRAGLTYTPEERPVTFTLGGAHITTGAFGDSDATFSERRIYQEALLRQGVGEVRLRHRYRSEQRWVDDQDFRTRYRYALFVDVPLNGKATGPGALYVALYDEIFINGETRVGGGLQVQRFDRNRLYAGVGYGVTSGLRVQGGYMWQTVVAGTKGQLQFSAHAAF